MTGDQTIEAYFAAMRRGSTAAEELLALFSVDAVYIEPFSGQDPAVGIDDIRERFEKGWQTPLPDLALDVLEIRLDGPTASARWECRSPALDGPVRGEDLYEFDDGLIARLEVRITGP